MEFGDKINAKISDRIETRASNKIDIIKKFDCGYGIVTQPNNKVDFLKRPNFLAKIVVGALNKDNIIAANRANMR